MFVIIPKTKYEVVTFKAIQNILEHMMKYSVVFLFVFFIASTVLSGQDRNIYNGKLIALNGDSIQGTFYARKYSWVNGTCDFFDPAKQQRVVYNPEQIAGFKLEDGRLFLSKSAIFKNDTLRTFFEVLLQGSASLYYLNMADAEYYFIEKEGSWPVNVNEPMKKINSDDQWFVYIPDHKAKLKAIFSDCNEIFGEIDKSNSNARNFLQITRKYNTIMNPYSSSREFKTEKIYTYLEFSLFTGIAPSKYNFGNKLLAENGFSYQAGLNIRLRNVLPATDRLSVNVNLIIDKDNSYTLSKYDKGDVYGEFIDYEDELHIINSLGAWGTVPSLRVNFGLWSLKAPILFEYDILNGKTTLSLNGGFSNRLIIGRNKHFVYRWFDDENGSTFNDYYIGYSGGISLGRKVNKKNKVIFDVFCERLLDPTIMYDFQRLRSTSLIFRLGYLL